MHEKEEKDLSTWFYRDKQKFSVRTEGLFSTVQNLYSDKSVLVILSENVPKPTDREIELELIAPKLDEVSILAPRTSFSRYNSISDDYDILIVPATKYDLTGKDSAADRVSGKKSLSDDEMVEGIVAVEKNNCGSDRLNKYRVYYSRSSGNLYWVAWLGPSGTVDVPFQYRVITPENKEAVLS